MRLPSSPSPSVAHCVTVGVVLVLAALSAGCTSWETTATATAKFDLPRTRLSRDTVVLEMRNLTIPENVGAQDLQKLWRELDEQHLDRTLRRSLADNGFRCGVFGSQLPDVLRTILDESEAASASGRWEQMESLSENSLGQRRLQARARRRYEIVTSPTRETRVVLTAHDGSIGGHTLRDAQCLLALRVFPRGDGTVRLELVPEIHHGPVRQRWTGSDGAFQPVVSRSKEVYRHLKIDTVLAPGETLALTSTDQQKGLGEQFFAEAAESLAPRKSMLILRLAQTQWDDLFESAAANAPLATSELQDQD